MHVLRLYHGGRDPAHRARERALFAAGIEVTLVVPTSWPEGAAEETSAELPTVELRIRRAGDVNRHAYASEEAVGQLLAERPFPEKGLTDAVRTLAHLNALRPTRLIVAGSGPDAEAAQALAAALGFAQKGKAACRRDQGRRQPCVRGCCRRDRSRLGAPREPERSGRPTRERHRSS